MLWILGSSLLHTGVVITDREYAYGGHDRQGISGVYWTRPRLEPPAGTFRCELLQGFTLRSATEIEGIIRDVSSKFLGTSYNLLGNNCNHFSSYLCEQLTGGPAPSWLNRAASIGVALPCVVPREWVAPPDHDTADGELLEGDETDERAAMLSRSRQRSHSFHPASTVSDDESWSSDRDRIDDSKGKGKSSITDGQDLSTSERAISGH